MAEHNVVIREDNTIDSIPRNISRFVLTPSKDKRTQLISSVKHIKITMFPLRTVGWCFRGTGGMILRLHNDFKMYSTTLQNCMEACLRKTDFKCLSFDWMKSKSTCYLSKNSKYTVGHEWMEYAVAVDYVHRKLRKPGCWLCEES